MDDGWPPDGGWPVDDGWPADPPPQVAELQVAPSVRRLISPIIPTTIALALIAVVAGVSTVRWNPDASTVSSTLSAGPASSLAATTATTPRIPSSAVLTPVSSGAATTVPAPLPVPKPLPGNGLYDGARPPQFVLVSFDGASDQVLMDRWTKAAAAAPAKFTFFLSMVYLLDPAQASKYQGPGHAAGESAIGFAPSKNQPVGEYLVTTIRGFQAAQRAGHELSTHFGGHWCGTNGVRKWGAADWAAELDATWPLATQVDANNGLNPPVGNPFLQPPIGARTPCLDGNLSLLDPVLAQRGFRYDASATRNLADWPKQSGGVWSFGFPSISVQGAKVPLLAVDYSLDQNLKGMSKAQVEQRVYDGYVDAFNRVYSGNRAPLELANHFTSLGGDAYNRAVERFVATVCPKPEVHCSTYREVTEWLDAHVDALPGFATSRFTTTAAA